MIVFSACTKGINSGQCVINLTVLINEENTWHYVTPGPVSDHNGFLLREWISTDIDHRSMSSLFFSQALSWYTIILCPDGIGQLGFTRRV